MECLTNKTIPNKTKITGNSGIIIGNGTNSTANTPVNIPNGMINTTDKIMENNKNMILNGMLKIYNPADKIFKKIITTIATRTTKNISISVPLYVNYFSKNTEIL